MPEHLSPGIYVEDIETGPKPIEGTSTSTAGFLGETERGPNEAKLITSWTQYQRIYGSYFGLEKYLPYAVEGFFKNGGQKCYIGRVVGGITDDSAKCRSASSFLLDKDGNKALKITAAGEGLWGDSIVFKVSEPSIGGFKFSIFYWKKDVPSPYFDPQIDLKSLPRPSIEEVFDNVSLDESSPDFFKKKVNGLSNLIVLDNSGPSLSSKLPAQQDGKVVSATNTSIEVEGNMSLKKDMFITVVSADGKTIQTNMITQYDDATKTATVQKSWDTDNLIDNTFTYHLCCGQLTGGMETDPATKKDYVGKETEGTSNGLKAFEKVDNISILYSPNAQSIQGLAHELIDHCEKMKDRFLIIDSRETSYDVGALDPRTNDNLESQYAAFYYPWIKIIDPQNTMEKLIPPGGYMAGIYARSDVERGVHKAPANETVRGVVDLQFPIGKGEQNILNPRGVNCIRAFPGRGIRVWGARTLSSDPSWKYINIRRLFIYLEESIDEGTQWVVFEPNSEILWARVIQTISNFLKGVWQSGALMGVTPEEAFFVKCDRTTMTQDDIDNGILIVMIGVAPVKPAEFVIFRIAQWTNNAK